ncbi:metallophosphoesterase [gut metagenome]|uniref:Metallophosphoesterase n=1 Tax=gut metagenome TaxID=749906 RepID=J9GIJ0_9ZZZZ
MYAQHYPVRPALKDPASHTMVLIPDVQSYVKFDANQPLLDLQTAWIANNRQSLRVFTALCTGDLVEQNNRLLPHPENGNQTSKEQWEAVSKAFGRLDGKIPYVLCTGNHDYGYERAENRSTQFPDYFPYERNSCWRNTLVATGCNEQGIPTLENAAFEFQLTGRPKLLIVSLEFAPRDEAIEWAQKLISNDSYKNHIVILLTHSYLTARAERYKSENYDIQPANYGQAIWDKLIYPASNIRLVLCGHECDIVSDYSKQVSFRMDSNHEGKTVAQMMFNAQTADGQWSGNGGDCWLRLLEFLPDGKTIYVRTFSPLFALSPTTCQQAWRRDSCDEFKITID